MIDEYSFPMLIIAIFVTIIILISNLVLDN
jgi:hypothetical protein